MIPDLPVVAPLLEQAVDASFLSRRCPNNLRTWVSVVLSCIRVYSAHKLEVMKIVICMRRIIILFLYSHVFIIIQYNDNVIQKLYFLMQYLSIFYKIHRSSYLKYGGPDPVRPHADPADPVVPTPLLQLDKRQYIILMDGYVLIAWF